MVGNDLHSNFIDLFKNLILIRFTEIEIGWIRGFAPLTSNSFSPVVFYDLFMIYY